MKIRYKTTSAGPNGIFHVGDVADVPDHIGTRLVAGGFADAIGVKAVASVAVQEVKEAVKREIKAKKPHKEEAKEEAPEE